MTNLNDIIKQAAKQYAKHGVSMGTGTQYLGEAETVDQYKFACFAAGASFATTDPSIIEQLIKNFVDWMEKEYGTIQNPHWVLTKYIQHLQTTQPKEDARPNS